MTSCFSLAEGIGATSAAFLSVMLLMKKYGIISFKKAEEKETMRHTCPVHEQAMAVLAEVKGLQKVNIERHEQHLRDFARGAEEFKLIRHTLSDNGKELAAIREGMDILLERRQRMKDGGY